MSLSADKFTSTAAENILLAVLAGIGIHFVFLGVNTTLLSIPGFELEEKEYKAVLLMASQKTLPVAVTVISFLPDSAGEQGLMVIPCIISHMSQIFIGAYIVSEWNEASKDLEEGRGSARDVGLPVSGGMSQALGRESHLESGPGYETAAYGGIHDINKKKRSEKKKRARVSFAEESNDIFEDSSTCSFEITRSVTQRHMHDKIDVEMTDQPNEKCVALESSQENAQLVALESPPQMRPSPMRPSPERLPDSPDISCADAEAAPCPPLGEAIIIGESRQDGEVGPRPGARQAPASPRARGGSGVGATMPGV